MPMTHRASERGQLMYTRYALGDDGRIHSQHLEIMAAHGCNLTCRSCTHASPALRPKEIADVESTYRDLRRLARVYHASRVKLLGGEPLLHPDLAGLANAVRASEITDEIVVATNGVLLSRMRPEFWAAVDSIWVSVYPGYEPAEADLALWRVLGAEHGVEVHLRHYQQFRESHSEYGTKDMGLVRRIFNTCQTVHLWRCHSLIKGMFYRCGESYFMPVIRGDEPRDGLAITDGADLAERLLDHLNSTEPLYACQFCLGTVGLPFKHTQVRRSEWRVPQQKSTEELVDYAYLAERERELPDSHTWYVSETLLRS